MTILFYTVYTLFMIGNSIAIGFALLNRQNQNKIIQSKPKSTLWYKIDGWIRYGRYNRLTSLFVLWLLFIIFTYVLDLSYYDYLILSMILWPLGCLWFMTIICTMLFIALTESLKWQLSGCTRRLGETALTTGSFVALCIISLFIAPYVFNFLHSIANEPLYQSGIVEKLEIGREKTPSFYAEVDELRYRVSGVWYRNLHVSQEIEFVTRSKIIGPFPSIILPLRQPVFFSCWQVWPAG